METEVEKLKNECWNHSKDEIDDLRNLGELNWSDKDEIKINNLNDCSRIPEIDKQKEESIKQSIWLFQDSATFEQKNVDLLDKLFEGIMYLDECNFLIKFLVDSEGNIETNLI